MICEQCDSYQNELALRYDELNYAYSERDTLETERDDARARVDELTQTLKECHAYALAEWAGVRRHKYETPTFHLSCIIDLTEEFAE